MKTNKQKLFQYDEDPRGKSVYFAKFDPPCQNAEELWERAKKGEQYGIISMKAEAYPDYVQKAKDTIQKIFKI